MKITRSLFISLILTSLIVCSCGSGSLKNANKRMMIDVQNDLIEAAADSTLSAEEALPVFMEFADTLYNRATINSIDVAKRVDAQKRSGIAMGVASMKFADDEAKLEQVLTALNKVSTTWVIDTDPKAPAMFKEIYIVTDDGMDDCIMVDVLFDEKDPSIVNGGILWMPHNATDDVSIVFSMMDEEIFEPNFDIAELADVQSVLPPGSMYATSPMAVTVSPSFVGCLKEYEVMFVYYTSTTGTKESFILKLDRLHEQLAETGFLS